MVDTDLAVCHTALAFHVGDVLKKLREERGWNIEDLAREAEVNKGTISGIERGKGNPRQGTLKKLARPFQRSAEDLYAVAFAARAALPLKTAQETLGSLSEPEIGLVLAYRDESGDYEKRRRTLEVIARRYVRQDDADAVPPKFPMRRSEEGKGSQASSVEHRGSKANSSEFPMTAFCDDKISVGRLEGRRRLTAIDKNYWGTGVSGRNKYDAKVS